MMNQAKCPKCDMRVLHVNVEQAVATVDGETKQRRVMTFSCIHCNTVLGFCGLDERTKPRPKRATPTDDQVRRSSAVGVIGFGSTGNAACSPASATGTACSTGCGDAGIGGGALAFGSSFSSTAQSWRLNVARRLVSGVHATPIAPRCGNDPEIAGPVDLQRAHRHALQHVAADQRRPCRHCPGSGDHDVAVHASSRCRSACARIPAGPIGALTART